MKSKYGFYGLLFGLLLVALVLIGLFISGIGVIKAASSVEAPHLVTLV